VIVFFTIDELGNFRIGQTPAIQCKDSERLLDNSLLPVGGFGLEC